MSRIDLQGGPTSNFLAAAKLNEELNAEWDATEQGDTDETEEEESEEANQEKGQKQNAKDSLAGQPKPEEASEGRAEEAMEILGALSTEIMSSIVTDGTIALEADPGAGMLTVTVRQMISAEIVSNRLVTPNEVEGGGFGGQSPGALATPLFGRTSARQKPPIVPTLRLV